MILADGLILATDGAKTLYLIEPDPSGFKSLASVEVLGEGGADSEGMSRVGGSTQNWTTGTFRWQASYPRPNADEMRCRQVILLAEQCLVWVCF
jgi:hypothetical protein